MDKRTIRYYPPEIKEEAKRLYAEGLSGYRIAKILGIPGQKPGRTVLRWARGVKPPEWVKDIPQRNHRPRTARPCYGCDETLPAGTERRQKFCSRSCAASYNNRLYPKRYSKVKCGVCGKAIDARSKLCKPCRDALELERILAKPIGSMFCRGASRAKFNRIREWARRLLEKQGREKRCLICGFDVTVEVCHLIPISDFLDSTPMGIVNCPENLVYLCPNHHAELDAKQVSAGMV